MRGSRVQQVVSELIGEKIDIIEYTEDTESLVKKLTSSTSFTGNY